MDEFLVFFDLKCKGEILFYFECLYEELDILVFYVSYLLDEVVCLVDYLVLLENGKVCVSGLIGEILV